MTVVDITDQWLSMNDCMGNTRLQNGL